MTLEEHAGAISAAIAAAAVDGFVLDDGDCNTPALDLNVYDNCGRPTEWVEIGIPVVPA